MWASANTTGPTLKTALCQICTLVGRMTNTVNKGVCLTKVAYISSQTVFLSVIKYLLSYNTANGISISEIKEND